MISRSEPQLFNILDQPSPAVGEPRFAAGCSAHTVSKDAETGAGSLLVRFPPGWRFEGELPEANELFVLDGRLSVSGRDLSCGWYSYLPADAGPLTCSSAGGATAYVFTWPSAAIAAREPVALSSFALPWEITILPGFPAGAMHKSLRPDDATGGTAHGGPGGFLRLVLTPPGWLSPREERHVGCWEENILLRGEMLMPGRGTIRSGDCLANPPGLWHGPMVTKGGAFFLVNCDAPMSVEYRDHAAGPAELEDYLEAASWG
jgi:hypothetical protein